MAQVYLGNTLLNQTWLGNTQINDQQKGTPFRGILDQYPGAYAAYSVRRLWSEYNGPIMTVRRSNDNATLDIGWDAQGNLDTGSLTTFVGANSGFVTTWYDQSTNDYHLTQNTNNRQARIIISGSLQKFPTTAGTLNPTSSAIYFNYDNVNLPPTFFQTYQVSFPTPLSQPYSWFDVIYIDGQPSLVTDGISTTSRIYRTGPNIQANAGSSLTLGDNFQLPQIYSAIFNGDISEFGVDYTEANAYVDSLNTGPAGLNSLDGIKISGTGSNLNYEGWISELILYPVNQSANRMNIVDAQNQYYKIF
jgi:Alpha-L-arabinofuranosidase B, catalytic